MSFLPGKPQPLFTILSYVLPVVILVIIWAPFFFHYYVHNVLITDHALDTARHQADDTVFDEINRFFQSQRNNNNKQLIADAEQILQERAAIPGNPSSQIGYPFNADNLAKKLPGRQLYFARLSIPYLLLRAYEATGRDDFLMAAKNAISGFASYERTAWFPKGLIWNDHAIAARISVMAKFWKLYRIFPHYDPKVARDIFQLVARSAELLAKPSHFTFATNHGVIQNLALLQICLAFPTLPNIDRYKELALERLRDQMLFYVNDEGVVLEHSAGYQKAGIKFLGMAFRYLTLLNEPIPQEWKMKYENSKDFFAQLGRPNGSLPLFGDTHGRDDALGPLITNFDEYGKSQPLQYKRDYTPKNTNSLYPVAGYSIWWDGLDELTNEAKLSQTVVAWSYFPGHAHKHADEMSVLLWADGQNWWTNIGYWTYGMKGRSEAVSWAGSNAPHLDNEPINSKRQTKLLGHGWSDSLAAIDLERKGPGGYIARRQVIQVKPDLWIILDHTFGSEGQRTTTTWTTSAGVNFSKGKLPGSYILETEGSEVKLTKFLLASAGPDIRQYKGSFSPFAGWEDQRPAPAIVIEQPAKNSWAAAIWLLQELDGESRKFNSPPFMKRWKNSANWQIDFPLASGLMSIWRQDNRVFVHQAARQYNIRKELQLSEPPQISDELAEIYRAYDHAAAKYPQKKYSLPRHLKASIILIVLFLVQEAFFLIHRRRNGKYYISLWGMSAFGWIAVGALLHWVYI